MSPKWWGNNEALGCCFELGSSGNVLYTCLKIVTKHISTSYAPYYKDNNLENNLD